MTYDETWIAITTERTVETNTGPLTRYIKKGHCLFIAAFLLFEPKGNFVTLRHGWNFMRDEKFIFNSEAEAEEFYDSGVTSWESMSNEDKAQTFQELAIFEGGHYLTSKFVAPSSNPDLELLVFAAQFTEDPSSWHKKTRHKAKRTAPVGPSHEETMNLKGDNDESL